MAYIYMVRCTDDSIYTGITTDLCRRMKTHAGIIETGSAKYMRSHGICKIEAVWQCEDYRAAAKLEYAVKHLKRADKLKLIENPLCVHEKFPHLSEYGYTPIGGITLESILEQNSTKT